MPGTPEFDRRGGRAISWDSRKILYGILNGRAGISPEMAVRLSIAFNTSADSWLNQQLHYDLGNANGAYYT